MAYLAALQNELAGHIELMTHMPMPRIQLPSPAPSVHTGDVNLNNINVQDSVVGAINTGTVERLDVVLTAMKETGDDALAGLFATVTEAIINDGGLSPEQKDEAVEQIEFLAEESRAPADQRRKGLARTALASVREIALTVTAATGAWHQIEKLLRAVF